MIRPEVHRFHHEKNYMKFEYLSILLLIFLRVLGCWSDVTPATERTKIEIEKFELGNKKKVFTVTNRSKKINDILSKS